MKELIEASGARRTAAAAGLAACGGGWQLNVVVAIWVDATDRELCARPAPTSLSCSDETNDDDDSGFGGCGGSSTHMEISGVGVEATTTFDWVGDEPPPLLLV